VSPADYRQRNPLLLVLGGALPAPGLEHLLIALHERQAALAEEAARLLVIVQAAPGAAVPHAAPFVLLYDTDGAVHARLGVPVDAPFALPVLYVLDRAGVVVAVSMGLAAGATAVAEDLLAWLAYRALLCPG
jgi:predicted metal-binding membrane protein